jgi:phosphotriesterase-related protein
MADAPPQVMTVLGPVPADELGPTIMHEHVLINMECYWQPPREVSLRTIAEGPVEMTKLGILRRNPLLIRDNVMLTDLDLAIDELREFRMLGGGTIVDVTLADIGRDPRALQIASRMTGLNIVCGCGHYLHLAHPASLAEESIESIAERIVREVRDGIDGTGVRPGVIGEIGTADPLHPDEEKVLRAAARAQSQTGLALTIHLDPSAGKGHEILDIVEGEGADTTKVVLDHLDATIDESLAYHRSLAERGAIIEYDAVGSESYWPGLAGGRSFWLPSDRVRARAVAGLFDAGFGEQVVLSHDVCKKMDLLAYGGFGYAHILRSFVANLRDFGLGEREIVQVTVENPRRVLVPSAVAVSDAAPAVSGTAA